MIPKAQWMDILVLQSILITVVLRKADELLLTLFMLSTFSLLLPSPLILLNFENIGIRCVYMYTHNSQSFPVQVIR